jgi:hypothetical protein
MENAVREKKRSGWRQPARPEETEQRDRDDKAPQPGRVKIRRPSAGNSVKRAAPEGERRSFSPSDGPRRAPAGTGPAKPGKGVGGKGAVGKPNKGAGGKKGAGKGESGDGRKRKVVVKKSKPF